MSKTVKIVIAAIFTIVAVAIVGSLASAKPDVDVANYNSSDTPAASAPASTTTAAKPLVKMTKSQEEAVAAAENYLEFMPFSKSRLVHQLGFDKFSVADATFAVNHIKVNWSDQAAKAAQTYLEIGHYSQIALARQLRVGDGYTKEQAAYGAKQAYASAS